MSDVVDAGTVPRIDERLPLVLLYALRVNRKFLRRPASVVFSVLQPITWLVLIGWVLDQSGATVHGVRYLTWFLPTAVALTIGYSAFQGGIGTALELEAGFDRRLVLMGARGIEMMAGRWLSDIAKGVVQATVLVVLGALLGADLTTDPRAWLVFAWVVVAAMVAGLALSNAIAITVRHSETTFAVAVVVVPVGLLLSDAFVPRADLPEAIRVGALVNPMAHGLGALREAATAGALLGPGLTGVALAALGGVGLALVGRRLDRESTPREGSS